MADLARRLATVDELMARESVELVLERLFMPRQTRARAHAPPLASAL